jgi:hypothetical protein
MGQDKKQLTKLLKFVKELYNNPDNKEFVAGIQSMIGSGESNSTVDSEKIEEIYEYCLEKNAKDQAEGLYDEFPFESIKDSLIEDYVIMERFRRKGDFLNFSAHLFLQIENICNAICSDVRFQEVYTSLIAADIPAYVSYNGDVQNRYSDNKNTTINKLIFGDFEVNEKGIDKKNIALSKLGMFDKVKCSLYFAAFGASMKSSNLGEWIYNTNLIYDIYLIRCQADHRGGAITENQEKRLSLILPHQNRFYALFFSELTYFVNKISDGKVFTDAMVKYAQSLVEVEEEYTVSSVLPSALYIKKEGNQPELVPANAYSRSITFEKGMIVIATRKGSIITKVKPRI